MLFRETVGAYRENYTEHIHTLCGGITLDVKVRIVGGICEVSYIYFVLI
jgi:hypothetical protein